MLGTMRQDDALSMGPSEDVISRAGLVWSRGPGSVEAWKDALGTGRT